MKRKAWGLISLVAFVLVAGCDDASAQHFDAKQTAKRQADKDFREGHTKKPDQP